MLVWPSPTPGQDVAIEFNSARVSRSMSDYFPLLVRAVAALSPNTKEQRQALYDRARNTLIEKMRDPSFSQADLKTESEALEAAIQRVEMDAIRRTAPSPRAKPRPKAYAAPPPGYRDRPPLTDPKKPLRIAAGALAAALVLGAGWAAYHYWPRNLSDVRTIAAARSVPAAAEQPDAKSDYVRLRQLVYFRTNQPVGTIMVDKSRSEEHTSELQSLRH